MKYVLRTYFQLQRKALGKSFLINIKIGKIKTGSIKKAVKYNKSKECINLSFVCKQKKLV